MADKAHEMTDEMLEKLEERIADEYAVASRDMQKKLREYLEQFAADMLKDENQTRGIYERCIEEKVFDALKGVVKLETKAISYEDFVKLQ